MGIPADKKTCALTTFLRAPIFVARPVTREDARAAPPWQTGQLNQLRTQSPSNLQPEKPTLSAEVAFPGSVLRGFVRYRFSTFPQALLAGRRWPLLCACQSGISHLRLRARVYRLVPS